MNHNEFYYIFFFFFKILTLTASFYLLPMIHAQHENVPYQDVQKICETCVCLKAQDTDMRYHHMLSCARKNFQHILARWPDDFGKNHNGKLMNKQSVSIFY